MKKKATNMIIEEILNHHTGGSLINVCGWLLAHQYPIAINGMSRKNKDSIYLLQQFIYGILGITRVSKMLNHPMNNITNSKIVFRLNGLQMLGVLRGGTK